MIDRKYLEVELPAQIEAAAQPLEVTIVLRSGPALRVRRLGRVDDYWATFETYPADSTGAIRGGRPTGDKRLTAGPGPHWAVVPFENISHVLLSVAEGDGHDVVQPAS